MQSKSGGLWQRRNEAVEETFGTFKNPDPSLE